MIRAALLQTVLLSLSASAQPTVITWAYGPFGTPGDAAYVVEDNRIYQACGAYGSRGPCLYIIEEDRVYHSADAFGRKGICAFIFEGNKLVRSQGTGCTRGSCALIMENEKVFRGDGTFCTKQEGAFYLEKGEGMVPMVVHLAEGPFAAKSEALLEVKGPLEPIALLAILAGY
jgi:hypothetical protein